jgi:predicted  nucleic acid-binding Zn-ribbon protein
METVTDTIRRITASVKRIESSLDNSNLGEYASVDLRSRLKQLQTAYDTLQTQHTAISQHVSALEQALQTAEQRCKDFEELNTEYRQENSRLKALLQRPEEAALVNENETLRQELREINDTAEMYQEQITALRKDYQELREEYLASESGEGHSQQAQEALERQVEIWKSRAQDLELMVAAFQRPAELLSSRSSSPSPSQDPSSAQQLCDSLLAQLHLNSNAEVLRTVKHLQHHSHLLRRLGDLIISVSGSKDRQALSSNQILKWVTQLADDYVAVQGALAQTKEVLSRLKKAARVAKVEDLVPRFQQLENELQSLRAA